MSRSIKVRAWDKSRQQMYTSPQWVEFSVNIAGELSATNYGRDGNEQALEIMQFTDVTDKHGVFMCEGDILHVIYTSGDGQYKHDGYYKVGLHFTEGLKLTFIKLAWEDAGKNQYPISNTLSFYYRSLDRDYRNGKYDALAIADTHGENILQQLRWKQNDYSNDITKIGNIYQNPELLNNEQA